MKSCNLVDGVVTQVFIGLAKDAIECPDWVAVGDTFLNGAFEKKPHEKTVTPDQIKLEARRRIENCGLPWMVERKVSTGAEIPVEIQDYAEAVRQRSNALESSLPDDFWSDEHWPERI